MPAMRDSLQHLEAQIIAMTIHCDDSSDEECADDFLGLDETETDFDEDCSFTSNVDHWDDDDEESVVTTRSEAVRRLTQARQKAQQDLERELSLLSSNGVSSSSRH